MNGEVDHFPFILAEKLHKFLWEIEELPNEEYMKWRSWHTYIRAMEDHAREVAQWR